MFSVGLQTVAELPAITQNMFPLSSLRCVCVCVCMVLLLPLLAFCEPNQLLLFLIFSVFSIWI